MNIEYIYLNVVYSPTTVRTFYKKLIINVIYNIQSQALEILYGISVILRNIFKNMQVLSAMLKIWKFKNVKGPNVL